MFCWDIPHFKKTYPSAKFLRVRWKFYADGMIPWQKQKQWKTNVIYVAMLMLMCLFSKETNTMVQWYHHVFDYVVVCVQIFFFFESFYLHWYIICIIWKQGFVQAYMSLTLTYICYMVSYYVLCHLLKQADIRRIVHHTVLCLYVCLCGCCTVSSPSCPSHFLLSVCLYVHLSGFFRLVHSLQSHVPLEIPLHWLLYGCLWSELLPQLWSDYIEIDSLGCHELYIHVPDIFLWYTELCHRDKSRQQWHCCLHYLPFIHYSVSVSLCLILECLRLLLERTCHVNCLRDDQQTPLHCAAAFGHSG